ncbi:MAG: hypothetical protein LBF27_14210 [Sphingobacterium sp.]|jgi:hypothetical protein|nr:hypothetical protein [Sphingobacterium sp.]
MKNFNHFAPIIILSLSCAIPQLGKQLVNLETFDLNFDVDRFYSPEIETAKLYSAQRDEILAGKKEEEFGDKLIDPWSFETIAVDSVFVDDIFAPSKQLVGLQYNMKSHTLGDSLALYGNMHFEGLNMMRSKEGNFMALVATKENENEEAFRTLLARLEKKYGKAKITEKDFFGGYNVYSWQLQDRLIAISSKHNDKSNELKVAIDTDRKTIDTAKHATIDTKFFLLSNKYRQAISGNLKSGAWLYFDKLGSR